MPRPYAYLTPYAPTLTHDPLPTWIIYSSSQLYQLSFITLWAKEPSFSGLALEGNLLLVVLNQGKSYYVIAHLRNHGLNNLPGRLNSFLSQPNLP